MAVNDQKIQRKLMLLHEFLKGQVEVGQRKAKSAISLQNGEYLSLAELREAVVGKRFHDQTLKNIEEAIEREIFAGKKYPKNPLLNSKSLGTFGFGQLLGFGEGQCRYIVDTKYSEYLPFITAMSNSRSAAKQYCETHSGCYHLYRYDLNPAVDFKKYPQGVIVKATLAIRYPVPAKPFAIDSKQGAECVRAKLNIPSYNDKEPELYKYDGLVGVSKGSTKVKSSSRKWMAWIFQGRFGEAHQDMEDLILMYTRYPVSTDPLITTGVMLTQNQDNYAAPTYAPVVIIRQREYRLAKSEGLNGSNYLAIEPSEQQFMRSSHALIDPCGERIDTQDRVAIGRLLREHAFPDLRGLPEKLKYPE